MTVSTLHTAVPATMMVGRVRRHTSTRTWRRPQRMQPRKARLPGWQWLIGVLGKTMRARSTAKIPSMTMGRLLNHSLISRKVTSSAYGQVMKVASCRGMIRNSP